jgi:predicted lactoylglutathione lyase
MSPRAWHGLKYDHDKEAEMARMLIPNLAVEDLDRSVAFFTGLGFEFDSRFTDDTATAMIVNEQATVMLLTKSKFEEFTTKELVDASRHTEAIIALSADSREDVDAFADKALATGGSPAKEPMDMGFMYGRSFADPDGHHWEIFWMDPAALEQSPAESGAAA